MNYQVSNIPFSKLLNTRDLGGLPTESGKHIRQKAFLRAASLYQLVPSDGDKLVKDYKVAYDIDLRIDKELSRQPDTPLPGVKYHHYQLREDVMDLFPNIPSMPEMYLNMVSKENSLEALRNIFRLFFEEVVPGEKAALFHCSEGKDRTGIVAALLEDLVGVPRDIILEDYILSNEAFDQRNQRYYRATRLIMSKKRADRFRKTYEADKTMLIDMFRYVDNTYGSTENFFQKALGFTEEEIDAFREKVLQ